MTDANRIGTQRVTGSILHCSKQVTTTVTSDSRLNRQCSTWQGRQLVAAGSLPDCPFCRGEAPTRASHLVVVDDGVARYARVMVASLAKRHTTHGDRTSTMSFRGAMVLFAPAETWPTRTVTMKKIARCVFVFVSGYVL